LSSLYSKIKKGTLCNLNGSFTVPKLIVSLEQLFAYSNDGWTVEYFDMDILRFQYQLHVMINCDLALHSSEQVLVATGGGGNGLNTPPQKKKQI
jgi:hypothetical protein